jgi:hypothetical protein
MAEGKERWERDHAVQRQEMAEQWAGNAAALD